MTDTGSCSCLQSLDAFRGASIAGTILVNNLGSWNAIYPQLEHVRWNGRTFTDLIFPFFLWIVGVAMTLSFAKRTEHGEDRGANVEHDQVPQTFFARWLSGLPAEWKITTKE